MIKKWWYTVYRSYSTSYLSDNIRSFCHPVYFLRYTKQICRLICMMQKVFFDRLHKNDYLSTKYSGKSSNLIMTKCIISNSVLFPPFFLFFPSFLFCLLPAHALLLKPKEISYFDLAGLPTVSRRCTYTLYFLTTVQYYISSAFVYRFHSASHSVQ